jgi:hypothetical protein
LRNYPCLTPRFPETGVHFDLISDQEVISLRSTRKLIAIIEKGLLSGSYAYESGQILDIISESKDIADLVLFHRAGFDCYASNRKLLGNSRTEDMPALDLGADKSKSVREDSKVMIIFPIFHNYSKMGSAGLTTQSRPD